MSAEINEAAATTNRDRAEVPGTRRPAERCRSPSQARWSRFPRPPAVALAAPSGTHHAAGGGRRPESSTDGGVPAYRGRLHGRKGPLRVPRHALLGAEQPPPSDRG